ncbi:conserved hypothetical protein [Gammaproteobacteria bacterium]
MSESELNSLELQVNDFAKSFRQLTIENNSLHKEVAHLHHERTSLLNKKKKIAESIRKIITQLQDKLS